MADQIISIRERERPDPQVEPPLAWPACPTCGLADDRFPLLERWVDQGRRAALATLVEVTGSSPRPLGSKMAGSDPGEVAGNASGGCIEAAVTLQASKVLTSPEPGETRLARFRTPAGPAIDARQPHAIALSILAELVALRLRPADCMAP